MCVCVHTCVHVCESIFNAGCFSGFNRYSIKLFITMQKITLYKYFEKRYLTRHVFYVFFSL